MNEIVYHYLCFLYLYFEKQNNKPYDKCYIDKFKKKEEARKC
jgi:hypothetical protein